jgi:hypothetical protein
MRIWTQDESGTGWRAWPDPLSGLAGLAPGWDGPVLLVSEAPQHELRELLATVRLVRRLCAHATLIAFSRHPERDAMAALRDAGVDRFWRPRGQAPRQRGRFDDCIEARADRVCPALHARSEEGVTVSVCGLHDDRLVLPQRQLERHCLADHEHCPYRAETGCPRH